MSFIRRKIFFEPALRYIGDAVWHPAVDVRRAPYGWLVKAELPGVAPEQVEVCVRGNSLLLSGVRRDTILNEGESCYAMEISYCRFERRVELPGLPEGVELRVSSDQGLLLVKLISNPSPEQP